MFLLEYREYLLTHNLIETKKLFGVLQIMKTKGKIIKMGEVGDFRWLHMAKT